MDADRQELKESFRGFSDEELLRRWNAGVLTDLAAAVAIDEARSRGLVLGLRPTPPSDAPADPADAPVYPGDLVVAARNLSPTEAFLLASFLRHQGIPAVVADANHVQANWLLSIALAGAKVRVPTEFLPQTKAALDALARGEFAIDEDFKAEDEGAP
jgi:hypothetical protein